MLSASAAATVVTPTSARVPYTAITAPVFERDRSGCSNPPVGVMRVDAVGEERSGIRRRFRLTEGGGWVAANDGALGTIAKQGAESNSTRPVFKPYDAD